MFFFVFFCTHTRILRTELEVEKIDYTLRFFLPFDTENRIHTNTHAKIMFQISF